MVYIKYTSIEHSKRYLNESAESDTFVCTVQRKLDVLRGSIKSGIVILSRRIIERYWRYYTR